MIPLLLVIVLTSEAYKPKTPTSKGAFINSGTPDSVTLSFDCSVREYAYEFGKSLQQRHGSFVSLFDALQLQACNQTRPKETPRKIPIYPKHETYNPINTTQNPCIYYVDPKNGNDSNSGNSPNNAFLTIEKAINITRNTRVNNELCTINLLEGIFYIKNTILLEQIDSFLTIQNYNGQNVTISGGIVLEFEDEWKLEKYETYEWRVFPNMNNVYDRANQGSDNDLVKYIGTFSNYSECSNAILKYPENSFYSWTWHDNNYGDFSHECFGVKDISWQPVVMNGIYSGRIIGSNIWSRKIKNINDLLNNDIPGLRVNNNRGIRARYPDQNPEISMQYDPLSGWINYDVVSQTNPWIPPNNYPNPKTIIVTNEEYPNVTWPMHYPGYPNETTYTGDGDWGQFWMCIGGNCQNMTPNYGYWCCIDSPRNNNMPPHMSPSGIYLDNITGINVPYYSNGKYGLVHAWHPYHWYNWIWNFTYYDLSTNKVEFDIGGFQGASGLPDAGEYYIDNIFEELTMQNEYFYNKSTNTLYYYYNSTTKEAPPNNLQFIATKHRVIFNISGNYRKQNGPIIQNITIRGITFKDTSSTYLYPHGLPSGGDWALSKIGAIYIQGCENCVLDSLFMTRLDGNGICLYGYNRNITITNNDFEWLGESAIVSWGYTEGLEDIAPGMGPDGRLGNQPRHTKMLHNFAHEIGIWEKQTSMYFQAQTAETTFSNNIFFNGPRAGILINDGFGGNNQISNNLIINTCRESSDHGNFNSWDRIPFITDIKNGTSSIIPDWNYIYNNFLIGNYEVRWVLDYDDGSSRYKAYNNFLVYGISGLKSNYGASHNIGYNNIYAYLQGNPIFFDQIGGAFGSFYNNSVIIPVDSYYTSNCDLPYGTKGFEVFNNSIYMPSPSDFTVCGMTLKQWQALGNDPGTNVYALPEDSQIIQWAKQLLGE